MSEYGFCFLYIETINIQKNNHSSQLARSFKGTTYITVRFQGKHNSKQTASAHETINFTFEESYRCYKEVNITWCYATSLQQLWGFPLWLKALFVVWNRLPKIDLDRVPLGMVMSIRTPGSRSGLHPPTCTGPGILALKRGTEGLNCSSKVEAGMSNESSPNRLKNLVWTRLSCSVCPSR